MPTSAKCALFTIIYPLSEVFLFVLLPLSVEVVTGDVKQRAKRDRKRKNINFRGKIMTFLGVFKRHF